MLMINLKCDYDNDLHHSHNYTPLKFQFAPRACAKNQSTAICGLQSLSDIRETLEC